MNNILVAITYHNQTLATVHKSVESALRSPTAPGWKKIVRVFCHDKPTPDLVYPSILTHQESLGGKRNFARNYARANNYRLISFLDDDDLFGPSWLPGVCAAYEQSPNAIFHPQWNVLFGPDWWKLHEHMGSNDPRFDSRGCLLNNPWSALCAFDPMAILTNYKEHLVTDKRLSFEDWTFNLDTYCNGFEHVAVKDTFHFLRIRENSLGKATSRCAPYHTEFFLDENARNRHHASEDFFQEKYVCNEEMVKNELKSIHEIEPQIYFWSQPKIEQEHYGRCQEVSAVVDCLGEFRDTADVFWTVDHYRRGGAEKALRFAESFLCRFPLSKPPQTIWIDDARAAEKKLNADEWINALRNVLRAWQDDPGSKARSLHICNSYMGWKAVTLNPALFDKVQVYFYVFNDDLRFRFPPIEESHTKGVHSLLYRFANMLDRPNFHVITDSHHFSQTIYEKTGIFARKISVPVVPQINRRKKTPTDKIEILWAGRLDDWKGIELLCQTAELLDPKKFAITAYGDGPDKWKEMLKGCKGPLFYMGPYKSFEYIEGEYDFFLFTSEREGMPNVVKEALSSGLNVIARNAPWAPEMIPENFQFHLDISAPELATLIANKSDAWSVAPREYPLDLSACIPAAMNAYKEALTWLP